MEVAKVLHMNGGNGNSSYARNSLLQRKVIVMTKSITDEAISALYNILSLGETLCIADLGCSSGPNTFLSVSQLIQTLHKETNKNGHKLPEFHVFLNDLPSNDFNTVFQSLPAFHKDLRKHNVGGDHEFGPPSCFVAGVAGSFYTRLFPANSLHFVHSSYSLHWLSQVPEGIEKNKGNVYLTSTSPPSVMKGYYEQYERDFVTFLKYRSKELMKGGMVLTILGRKNEDPFSSVCSYECGILATTLKLFIAQGSIDEEQVVSFNIPAYNPSPAEVMCIVEKEGSFTIDVLETSEIHRNSEDDEKYNMVQSLRSVAEPLLVSHFGHDELNMDQVFHKYAEIFTSDYRAKEKIMFVNITVSLSKTN